MTGIAALFGQNYLQTGSLAILDMNGSARAADVLLIGAESEVRGQLDAYADAGATDFLGAVLADRPDEAERTDATLADYASR